MIALIYIQLKEDARLIIKYRDTKSFHKNWNNTLKFLETKLAAAAKDLEGKFWTSVTHLLDFKTQHNYYALNYRFNNFLMVCNLTYKLEVRSNILMNSNNTYIRQIYKEESKHSCNI